MARAVRGLLWVAAGCAAWVFPGCRPAPTPAGDAAQVRLEWRIAPDPPVAGPVRLALTLTEAAGGRPVTGATVRVEANMSHPGMQPVLGTAREVAPGTYEAPLELTMGGDWFLLVEGTLADGSPLSRQVDLPGVRSR